MLEWSLIRETLGRLEDKLFNFRTLIIISAPKIDAECDKPSGTRGGMSPTKAAGGSDGPSKHKVLSLENKNLILFGFFEELFSRS